MVTFKTKFVRSVLFLCLLFVSFASQAFPMGNMIMVYVKNPNNTYTYYFVVKNMGPPIMTPLATPANYYIYNTYFAGGKLLEDDEYVVLFGLDTKHDDLTISNVTNANTAFVGAESQGFSDSNNNGIPNQVISWHLPNVFTLDQTIPAGEYEGVFSFTLDKEVTDFEFWVGASDDTEIFNANHTMLVDFYGQFDLEAGEYLSTFMTHKLKTKRLTIPLLLQFLNKY